MGNRTCLEKVGFCLFVSSRCWGPVHHSSAAINHGSGGRGVFTERLVWNGHNSFTFLLLSFLAFPEQVLMPLNLVSAAFFSVQTVLLHTASGERRVLSLKITIKSAIALLSQLFWTDQKLRILADPRNIHMRVSHALRTLKMVWGWRRGCRVSWDLRPFLCCV